jgi:hypothetical protein
MPARNNEFEPPYCTVAYERLEAPEQFWKNRPCQYPAVGLAVFAVNMIG